MFSRCSWCISSPLLINYHDAEWGVPVHDESKHFEFLFLETMQAGLSWRIILEKREAFRQAFDSFDYLAIAQYGPEKIDSLLKNPGIIKNRKKIEGAVTNAGRFQEIQAEWGSFDSYIWSFTNWLIIDSQLSADDSLPAANWLSDAISRDLKHRGFSYIGSITIYAHLQAIGVVMDHRTSCFRYRELKDIHAHRYRPSGYWLNSRG